MNNAEIYKKVSERIIAQLEKGVVPWRKGWKGTSRAFNRISKKPYSLLNQCLLTRKGEYATFKQWTDLGGKIKKGAKSEIIVFWKMLPIEEEFDGEITKKVIPLLKYYNVFHIDDVEGVEPLEKEEFTDINPIEKAEEIVNAYIKREGITYENVHGDKAFYRPSTDSITLPLVKQFNSAEEYYGTLFHEMVHSTGHQNRLNRLSTMAMFGNEEYSKEELVAESGASMLCGYVGIDSDDMISNNASYIQSWINAIKGDNKLVVSAFGQAEKGVNYILGITE